MFRIIKEVRDINRFREILTVLFEEGFDFLIGKVRLKHKVPITKLVKARIEKKKPTGNRRARTKKKKPKEGRKRTR